MSTISASHAGVGALDLHGLPHAGGDPELAAQRASHPGALVRLLPDSAPLTRPARTVTVGSKRFELNDHRDRRPTPRALALSRSSLEDDLPAGGWIEVPADPDAIWAHARAARGSLFLEGLRGVEDALRRVRAVPVSVVVLTQLLMDRKTAQRTQQIRDEYARLAAAGRL